MDNIKETVCNDAYLLTCYCPTCYKKLPRSFKEEVFYCRKCGQKLHTSPFSDEEIEKALFEREMDCYED